MDFNMKLTIKDFFTSVYDFIDKTRDFHTLAEEQERIETTIREIENIQKLVQELINQREIKGYDARILMDKSWLITSANYTSLVNAFVKPESSDNRALVAYRDVLRGICEYYTLPVQNPATILSAIKTWKIITADSRIKSFKYQISPLSKFAIKNNTK